MEMSFGISEPKKTREKQNTVSTLAYKSNYQQVFFLYSDSSAGSIKTGLGQKLLSSKFPSCESPVH